MSNAVVGIDPGVNGAAVALEVATGKVLHWFDTPTIEVPGPRRKGKTTVRQEYAEDLMTAELEKIADAFGISLVVIEKVTPMPRFKFGRGADGGEVYEGRGSSSFTDFGLGRGMGIWEGICAGLKLKRERVSPLSWKPKIVGHVEAPADLNPARRKGLVKEAARLKALQLFPGFAHALTRKSDDGRAEAALIAEYGRRMLSPAPF